MTAVGYENATHDINYSVSGICRRFHGKAQLASCFAQSAADPAILELSNCLRLGNDAFNLLYQSQDIILVGRHNAML